MPIGHVSSHACMLTKLGEYVQMRGMAPEASRRVMVRQPAYRDFSEALLPLVPLAFMRQGTTFIRRLWLALRFTATTNTVWLSTLGAYMQAVGGENLGVPDSALRLISGLLDGRVSSLTLDAALSMAYGGAIGGRETAQQVEVYRTMACASDDVPVDIALPRTPVSNSEGTCDVYRTRPWSGGGRRCTDARPMDNSQLALAWGFACTTEECGDAASQDSICMPLLMPQPQGRPGQSEFPFRDLEHLLDDVWMNPVTGEMKRIVNVAQCRCMRRGRRRRDSPGMDPVSIGFSLLLYGIAIAAIVSTAGGAAAPIFSIYSIGSGAARVAGGLAIGAAPPAAASSLPFLALPMN
jgi:hypothetical protein